MHLLRTHSVSRYGHTLNYLALVVLLLPLIHVLQVLWDLGVAKLFPRLGRCLRFVDLIRLETHVLSIDGDCIA